MEYRQAIRHKKDILLFLLNKDVRKWPGSEAEKVETQIRLEALRTELTRGERMPDYFSSCIDLAFRAAVAIANHTSPPRSPKDMQREDMLLNVLNSEDSLARDRASKSTRRNGKYSLCCSATAATRSAPYE